MNVFFWEFGLPQRSPFLTKREATGTRTKHENNQYLPMHATRFRTKKSGRDILNCSVYKIHTTSDDNSSINNSCYGMLNVYTKRERKSIDRPVVLATSPIRTGNG
jgi:hypothetical protein